MGTKNPKRNRRHKRRAAQKEQQSLAAKAQRLLQEEHFAESAHLLRGLLAKQPADDELRRLLAEALRELQDYPGMAQVLLPVVHKDTYDLVRIVVGLTAAEEWAAAVPWGEQLVAQVPEDAAALHLLARAYCAGRPNGRLDRETREKLFDLLRRAVAQPDCPEEAILWLVSLTSLWDGVTAEPEPAEDDLAAMLNFFHLLSQDKAGFDARREKGRQMLVAALAQNPTRSLVRLALVKDQVGQKDWEAAYNTLLPLLTGEAIAPEAAWQAYLILAAQVEREIALSYLDLIPYGGQGISAAKVRGDVLMAMGRFHDASACYSQEVEREDVQAQIAGLAGRALARIETGDLAGTAADCTMLAERWLAAAETGTWATSGYFRLQVGEDSESYSDEVWYVPALCGRLQNGLLERLDLAPTVQGQLHFMTYHCCSDRRNAALLLQAAALLQHPLLDYDLMWHYAQTANYPQAVAHWLSTARWEYGKEGTVSRQAFYFEEDDAGKRTVNFPFTALSMAERQMVHGCALAELREHPPTTLAELDAVYMPFYHAFWRALLFPQHKNYPALYAEIAAATSLLRALLSQCYADTADVAGDFHYPGLTWDLAYAMHGRGDLAQAAALYREYLTIYPAVGSALHNLSIVVEQQGDLPGALELSARAVATAPQEKMYTERYKALQKKAAPEPARKTPRPASPAPRPAKPQRPVPAAPPAAAQPTTGTGARPHASEVVPLVAGAPAYSRARSAVPVAEEEDETPAAEESAAPPEEVPSREGRPQPSLAVRAGVAPTTGQPAGTAKGKRKAIGKRLRFEIFKRDQFKCQYCGRTAPEIVLVVDHITPVAEGGDNDIMNLITSCAECNAGKGARPLQDGTAVAKRKGQLDELQARREQIEMMLEWQRGLTRLEEDTTASLAQLWSDLVPGYGLNPAGQATLRKMARKFGIPAVGEAMRIAADSYLQYGAGGQLLPDSVGEAWSRVSGICYLQAKDKEDPGLKELYYIRGILRKRLAYVNPWMSLQLLRQAREAGIPLADLQTLAREVTSWSSFQETMEEWIAGR